MNHIRTMHSNTQMREVKNVQFGILSSDEIVSEMLIVFAFQENEKCFSNCIDFFLNKYRLPCSIGLIRKVYRALRL